MTTITQLAQATVWIGLAVGAGLGLLQWLVLRHYIRRPGWWMSVSIVGASAITPMAMAMFLGNAGRANPRSAVIMTLFIGLVIVLAVFGAVLGIVVAVLLRQPAPPGQDRGGKADS